MAAAPQLHHLSSFLLVLVMITTHLLPLCSSTASPSINDARDHLVHVDAHLKLTHDEKAHSPAHRARLPPASSRPRRHKGRRHHPHRSRQKDHPAAASIEIPLQLRNGKYYFMNLSIGNPPVHFSAIVDTGSDLTWTKCDCAGCSYASGSRTLNPGASSSYADLPCTDALCSFDCQDVGGCSYGQTYGSLEQSHGSLSTEAMTLGSMAAEKVIFGCSFDETSFEETAGIVGLGRGPRSLVSQLGSMIDYQFSYCLSGLSDSRPSRLVLGPEPSFINGSISAPMLTNPRMPNLYFVALKGISVGGKRLQIPSWLFQIDQTGTGGFFVDSGSRYMCLFEPAYSQVLGAFVEAIGLPIEGSPIPDLSACFGGLPSSISIPSLTLHFENGDLHLPLENYFVVQTEDQLSCLAIIRTPFGHPFSVIGTITVQNIHVNYDVGKRLMTFTPTQCDKL